MGACSLEEVRSADAGEAPGVALLGRATSVVG